MFSNIYDKTKKFIHENLKFIIGIVLLYLLFTIELPYVIYAPGGYISLNNRVIVEDGYESSGDMGMAYVSVVKSSIPFVLASYIIPNWDLVSSESITLENESIKEMNARDRMYLQNSIDNAIIAAYTLTGNSLEIIEEKNNIEYITKSANTSLKLGDVIIKVDGNEYDSIEALSNYIQTLEVGDEVEFLVNRDGENVKASANVYEEEDRKMVGIMSIVTYEYNTEPKVEIKVKQSEAGPSGGLMMALSVYNSLVKEDITDGRKIIGTGTISKDGVVGEIGGVKYKLMGAVKKDAEIFLCPEENLEEALALKIKNNYDIKVIGVSTLKEAIEVLKEDN